MNVGSHLTKRRSRGLPVVVPPVEDGVVEAALEGDVRRG